VNGNRGVNADRYRGARANGPRMGTGTLFEREVYGRKLIGRSIQVEGLVNGVPVIKRPGGVNADQYKYYMYRKRG